MNLGLETIAPKAVPSTSCSYEEVLIAQSESAEALFNLTNYVNTFSNLVDIYNHISKFGITEESKSLFSASFENVGLTFSTESVLTVIKNTISRIREWIKIFIEKIKELFAKFFSNSQERVNVIKQKIADIKAIEQKYRFDNLASDVKIEIHYLDNKLIDRYVEGMYERDISSLASFKEHVVKKHDTFMREWEKECNWAKEEYETKLSLLNKKQSDINKEIDDTKKQLDEAEKECDKIDIWDKSQVGAFEKLTKSKVLLKMKVDKLEKQRGRCAIVISVVNEFGTLITNDIEAIKKKAEELAKKAE